MISCIPLLSNCAVYKGSFDCKANKGIGCASVSRVNELVDDGKLEQFIDDKSAKKQTNKCSCQIAKQENNTQNRETKKREEKITIHFNEYQEKGITHKSSEIEVTAK